MYEVSVRGLELFGQVGCREEERKLGVRLSVDLTAEVEGQAGVTDDVQDTIDYEGLALVAVELAEEGEMMLLERFAVTCAERILERHERVQAVEIEIRKPNPPIAFPLESVGVAIRHERVQSDEDEG